MPKVPKVLHGLLWREGEYYVGLCLELSASGYGRTPEEARHETDTAVNEYLQEIKDAQAAGQTLIVRRARHYLAMLALWHICRLLQPVTHKWMEPFQSPHAAVA